MSDAESIQQLGRRAAARLQLRSGVVAMVRALDAGMLGLTAGLAVAFLALYGFELEGAATLAVIAGAGALAVALMRGVLFSLGTVVTPLEGAKAIDDQLGLKDTISSAIELGAMESGSTTGGSTAGQGMARHVIASARQAAEGVHLTRTLPLPKPGELMFLPVHLAVSAVLIGALGTWEPVGASAAELARRERESAREAARIEKVRDELAERARELSEESTDKRSKAGEKAAKALKKAAGQLKPETGTDRRSALRKLADTKRKLEQQRKKFSFDEALDQAIAILARVKQTRPLARRLQVRDFEGAIGATASLAETLPEETLKPVAKEKLIKATSRASEVLMPTKLRPLAEALAEIAEALRSGDKDRLRKALNKLAKRIKDLKNMRRDRRLVEKALQALERAKFQLGRNGDGDLPFKKMKLPGGKGSKAEGKQKALPILPGPIRPGGGQGPGQAQKVPMYLGPCSMECGFEGQCMKCPCRGKKICPATKKVCPCNYCQSRAGGGQGQGKGQGQGQGQGGGEGGTKPGWGSNKKSVDPQKLRGMAKKTKVKGLLGKKGESAIMAVKTANDGSRSSAAEKEIFQEYRQVEEESLYREKVPLSKRDLVRKYFDAIKPRD